MTRRIVVLPGDGIGPEVTGRWARWLPSGVASATRSRSPSTSIGGAAVRAGRPPLPDATLEACREADAVLLGAVGDPAFDRRPREQRPNPPC